MSMAQACLYVWDPYNMKMIRMSLQITFHMHNLSQNWRWTDSGNTNYNEDLALGMPETWYYRLQNQSNNFRITQKMNIPSNSNSVKTYISTCQANVVSEKQWQNVGNLYGSILVIQAPVTSVYQCQTPNRLIMWPVFWCQNIEVCLVGVKMC